MKLAISNIAWPRSDEEMVADILADFGLSGVEIAPTTIWANPLEATANEIHEYRNFWEGRGIEIVAMQALLYGKQDLTIFENSSTRETTLEYLAGIIKLGAKLGARVLVFGSPKNRKRGILKMSEAKKIAEVFFRAAGEIAVKNDVILCIEPNPVDYQCDFLNTSEEGLDFVTRVDSEGFGLHLDSGGMTLSDEPLRDTVLDCAGAICHFHASQPFLAPFNDKEVDHRTIASALREIEYPNWVSVEMRNDPGKDKPREIGRVLRLLREHYG